MLDQIFAGAPKPPRPQQKRVIERIVRAGLLDSPTGGIVAHATGSGKSITLSELIRILRIAQPGVRIVVSTPTVDLVEQLTSTIASWCATWPAQYYTRAKRIAPVTVVCVDSMPRLAAEMQRRGLPWDVWIADECHRTESDYVSEALAVIEPTWRVGFSATPYLSDETQSLSLWTHEIDRYSIDDAISDGVLVPFRIEYPDGGSRKPAILDDVCGEWIANATGPGVVSARSIAEAEAYARYLRERFSVCAGVIHSKMTKADQDARLAELERGELRCLVHVRKLVEGVDFPWLQWIVFRAPRGRVALPQELGRVLRSHPGKTHARVFDPHRLLLKHGLNTPAALFEPVSEPEPEPEPEPRDKPEQFDEDGHADDTFASLGFLTVSTLQTRDQWVANALIYLRAAGLAKQPPATSEVWRGGLATDRQADLLAARGREVERRRAPDFADPVRASILQVVSEATEHHRISRLRAGACSDRIDLCAAFVASPARLVDVLQRYGIQEVPE